MRCWAAICRHVPHRVLSFLVLWYLGVIGLREERDDVPGMKQSWNVAQDGESDVDEGIGATYATFDPH